MDNILPPYDPANWFWRIGDDDARYWSSAASAYVDALPDGAGASGIRSEDELTDVLADYGLPGPLPRAPASVSARQFKLQLLASGLLAQVEAFIASQGQAVQIAYDNSGYFVRSEPMMQSGFEALGFTTEQIDAFFTAAAQL
ncbi:hypothetical protein MesoLj113c_14470 [Mesorhizobium sp. 113-3-9]|uniref:hypothetical protein n=1 Tax=Mesorhizobium sp. 113-3-9 TaxID=2744517 RepID=UPI0019358144|nr:hypothetical protein [Mesorhizobium sp. 113-3-9]BCG85337.1 hypothetical protein MesoLj113c_14470 [Mesorhizobium sp. 113-3-9]